MPTIIAYHPLGYEVHFEVEPGELDAMVRKLERHRFRASRELARTAEGLPICPRHGVPMARRSKQGDEWFSHKVTDPDSGQVLFCRGYAAPSSPWFRGAAGSWAAGRSGRGQQHCSGQKWQQPADWPRRHQQAESGAD
jgi:hypothetical protein